MNLSKEQLRILKTFDVDTALKDVAAKGFIPSTREIALAGLHIVRLRVSKAFTHAELEASRDWLREHNYIMGVFNGTN